MLSSPSTFFGLWVSAIDPGNGIQFFSNGQLLNPGYNIGNAFNSSVAAAGGNANTYFGNPNALFAGQNSNQAYAYLNFVSDTAFDEVRLYGGNNGTLELDNIVAGNLVTANAVPEPATWAMMLVGFGLVGVTARRRALATHAV